MFVKHLPTLSISALLLLSSCGSIPPGEDVDWKNGAQGAWITEIYSSESLNEETRKCLGTVSQENLENRHFAMVTYRRSRRLKSTIAELPDSLNVNLHDYVEVWLEKCASGKVSRISRVIHS
jgi:hypothetical protein